MAGKCGPNEKYNTCGTACPKTCENRFKQIICTFQCVAGCFCVDGYVRDKNNRCIKESECPKTKKCGPFEIYETCGTACPKTCENKDKPIKCTKQCVFGCFCIDGYVRDKNNRCIKESECPKPCSVNEEYSECGASFCQNDCANPRRTLLCKGSCVAGCICKEGYLRNSRGVCVLPEHCATKPLYEAKSNELARRPPRCPQNENYSECGANGCQNTCQNPTLSQVCKAPCIAGCVCKEGYLRNSKGKCVLVKNCDCTKPNEVFSKCGNHGCQNTCEEPDLITRCTFLPGCYPGCICKKGFLRNIAGDCIPENKCPPPCGPNESYNSCGSACIKTCENRLNFNEIVCPAVCIPGCYCNEGYVRDNSNMCIPEDQCP